MAIDLKLDEKPWWQAAALGALVAAILVAVGEMSTPGFKQKRQEIESARNQLTSLNAEIEKGRAAERKLAQFREEVKKLELELQKLLQVLPPARDTEDLIKKVEALVHQGDFTLTSFKTSEPVPKEFYKEYPMNVAVIGTYHNLALFFMRLGNFSRIINVEDLKIHGIESERGKTITATFVAKTFIYTGDSNAAAPAAGTKPPRGGNPVGAGADAIKGKGMPTE